MSVGTPAAGITAPVLVVNSFEDLQRHAAEAKGKIVLFDYPFPHERSADGRLSASPWRIAAARPPRRRRSARSRR